VSAPVEVGDLEPLPVDAYADEPGARARPNGAPASEGSGAAPFEVRRLDDITVDARRAVVQGLGLDESAVAAIVGSPNAGKTAFAVSLALAVASRTERWLNLKVAGGPALYFGAEAPASVKMRARAAAARMEAQRAAAFYISEAVPAIGGEFTAAVDAERIIATVEVVQAAEGERVRLVFIDTLASCLGDGDENSDGMLRLVAAAKLIAARTSACVVLIHHPSKGDGAALRGHGSLSAACDSIIRIEVEELSGVRTATLVKARDHATGLQLRFELEAVALPERDSFGDPCTTVVVRPSGQPAPRPRPSGQRQRELLTELERRYRTGERQWDEATVCKGGRDLGMPRNSPADALRGLMKSGYVVGSSASLSLKYPPEDPK
jgi:KaiC/GvpD/RAD55 family RecA-like ATPase